MTVTLTSSRIRSSMTVPKMMFASGSAASLITSAASLTSNRPRSLPPVTLNRMPRAPVMLTSSSGLMTAARAASTARFSPDADADAHHRASGLAHDRLHVGEVEVDEAGDRDEIADALHALAQHVVHHAEGVDDRGLLVDHLAQPVVRDGDQGVDLLLEQLGVLLCHQLATHSLEAEWLGHHADRQGSEVLGDLGDDRCRTRAGATAHAGGDEDHVGVLERLVDLLRVLFGGALSHIRVGAGAQAARHLVADADLVRRVALEERLRVGVHADELDAHHLCADHPVDGVAAAASDADDLDECEVLGIGSKRHVGWSLCTAVWLELFNPRASTGLSDSSEAARAPSALFPQWCSELSTGRRSVVDDRAGCPRSDRLRPPRDAQPGNRFLIHSPTRDSGLVPLVPAP